MAQENLAEDLPRDHERANFKIHVYLKASQKLKQASIESIVRDFVDEAQVLPVFRADDLTFSKIVDQWMELTKIVKIEIDLLVGGRNVPFDKFTPKYKVIKWARETLAEQPGANEDSEVFLNYLNNNKQKFGAKLIKETFNQIKNEQPDQQIQHVLNIAEQLDANEVLPAEPIALFDANLFDFLEPIAAEGLAAGIAPETAPQNFMDVFDDLQPSALFGNFLAAPFEADFLDNIDFLENDLSLPLDF